VHEEKTCIIKEHDLLDLFQHTDSVKLLFNFLNSSLPSMHARIVATVN